MLYKFKILLLPITLILCQVSYSQPINNSTNNDLAIASIDSNTIKLRNKLYPQIPAGDLNIYGFEENDVPVYADSVYKYRLSLLETEIPLDYNQYVKGYIDLYAIRKRALVSKILSYSAYYFPIVEDIFNRENIPLELKYLAVIESALNQNAVSPVGATGMWQFMAPTGKMYGLKTNHSLDERRDLIKSTEAAVKYFKNSYRIYGDWLLVIASYNCGPGNVSKAIRKSGGKRTFWEIMPYLPKETRGYVPAFVAATYVMNYAPEHNLYSANIPMYYHLDTVMVDNRYSVEQLSLALDMPIDEIKNYNPSLRKGYIPFSNDKIVLTLPYNKAVKFAALNDSNIKSRAGDTELLALNNDIQISKSRNASNKSYTKKIIYKVRRGELLATIADKFNVSISEVKKWNHLRGSKIKRGQRLTIFAERA